MALNLTFQLFLSILALLTSCNEPTAFDNENSLQRLKGDTVNELGKNIMVVYQDRKNQFWFGSWETGVYRYDGNKLVNYTTKHGLLNNRIDEIKEDELGNIYFSSANATSSISKFNGSYFTTVRAVPSNDWKLLPTDIWFEHSYGNTGKVYRYDGATLHELQFPNPPNLSNPFDVYSIYEDNKGCMWFGTNPVGVCRFDGTSYEWITEEDVTEFRNEGANGVRSIIQDKNGDFWFNTEFRYRVYDSATMQSNNWYTRHESIGGLDGKKNSDLDEYLSSVKDNEGNLWFVTYMDGVWMYDGTKITHYAILEDLKEIKLFSIYKDTYGQLWIGTPENGAWKFNGQRFEKFRR